MADVFYNKTVTVYNKTTDDLMGTETWYPTVLENVRLLVTHGANVQTSGLESADTAKLFVKTNNLTKPYLKPLEWQGVADKTTSFTFCNSDFFVEGDTTTEDCTQEDFFSYMKLHYDNCFKVTNVDTYELIPHLEVGGA